jgi:hypothetical protein
MQWLFFAIIGAVVAYGVHRMSREKREEGAFGGTPHKDALPAQDMVQCSVCQTYVVKSQAQTVNGAIHCGREDCLPPKQAGE